MSILKTIYAWSRHFFSQAAAPASTEMVPPPTRTIRGGQVAGQSASKSPRNPPSHRKSLKRKRPQEDEDGDEDGDEDEGAPESLHSRLPRQRQRYSQSPAARSITYRSPSPEPSVMTKLPRETRVRGHALLLSFENTDLPSLSSDLSDAFRGIACSVDKSYMDSEEFETSLAQFLDRSASERPRIIYISCHGVGTPDDRLLLCSHGPFNDGTSLPWSTLQSHIDSAHCDVLVVLTCCHGGLAKISNSVSTSTTSKKTHKKHGHHHHNHHHYQQAQHYAKELITTAGWGESTLAHLGEPAMVIALDRWYWASSLLTGLSLHDVLTRVIKEMREEEMRKGRDKIQLLEDRERQIQDDISRMEGDLRGMGPRTAGSAGSAAIKGGKKKTSAGTAGANPQAVEQGGQGQEKQRCTKDKKKTEALIKKQKRKLKEIEVEKEGEEESLQESRLHHTQPHFMRAELRVTDKYDGEGGGSRVWKL